MWQVITTARVSIYQMLSTGHLDPDMSNCFLGAHPKVASTDIRPPTCPPSEEFLTRIQQLQIAWIHIGVLFFWQQCLSDCVNKSWCY